MKQKLLFILTVQLLFLLSNIFAQVKFQKTYGGISDDFAQSVKQTFDGGYIITGSTQSFGVGPDDVYLLKTDSFGNILWTKTYGKPSGLNSGEFGKIVEQTRDSGYIIACDAFFNNWTIFLIKTNSFGDTIWTRNFGYGEVSAFSVQQTSDGGYIIGGSGTGGAWLIKLDSFGDSTWTKKVGVFIWGSSYGEYSNIIKQTSDGGYIFASSDHTLASNLDFTLIKSDSNGNIIWSKVYGSLGDDFLESMFLTSDGGYIMVGCTKGFGAGGNDIYLIKTDSLGLISWSKTFGSVREEMGYSVQQTIDGGYIVGGTSSDSLCVIKTDSNGQVIWSNLFLAVPEFHKTYIEQTSDSGYIISNATKDWASSWDVYLIKTDANGNSGCNQIIYSPSVFSPSTFSSAKAFNVSPGCLIENTAVQISSGGVMTQSCLTIGLDETIKNNLYKVFPNPASQNLTIELISNINKPEFKIFNTLGKLEYSSMGNQLINNLNISFLLSGIYILEIIDGRNISRMKFIKQ